MVEINRLVCRTERISFMNSILVDVTVPVLVPPYYRETGFIKLTNYAIIVQIEKQEYDRLGAGHIRRFRIG